MQDQDRQNSERRCILVIGLRIPSPDMDSGSFRMFNLLILLKEMSDSVSFVALHPQSWPPFDSHIEKDKELLRKSGIAVPEVSSLEQYIKSCGEEYDAVILSDIDAADSNIDIVRKYASQALIIFDTVDLHFLRYYREAKETGNINILKKALDTKKRELTIARKADCTLVVSPVEKNILKNACPELQVHIISNVHEPYAYSIPYSERRDIVFVGSFQHSPNLDAAHYLIEDIFPLIKNKIEKVKLYVVGSSPPDSIAELSSENVMITGFVDDLTSLMNKCRVSVAPLRFGAGVKGKVLQSISCGLPVVGSSIAVEGSYLTHNLDVLIADTPENFCQAVVDLYKNRRLWDKISRNGLEIISKHFSLEATQKKLTILFEQMVKRNKNGSSACERDNAGLQR